MVVSDSNTSFENLVSEKLQTFSQLTESLTLRLLELEERINGLEGKIATKNDSQPGSTYKLLVESEARLKHLQGLLDGTNEGDQKLYQDPSLSNNDSHESNAGIEEELLTPLSSSMRNPHIVEDEICIDDYQQANLDDSVIQLQQEEQIGNCGEIDDIDASETSLLSA